MCFKEVDLIITQIKAKHCDKCKHFRCTLCDIDEVLILLEEADDADVVEVKHGYWKDVKKHLVAGNPYQHTCGICGKSYFDHNIFNHPYCPNCGAKMDGERRGE